MTISLPPTRRSVTHKFSVGGFECYLTVGLTHDGRPAELFAKVAKQGSVLNGMLACWCRSTSYALRAGVPVEKVVEGFKDMRFDPMGPAEGDDRIPEASSLVDYVARWLELEFCKEATA